MLTVNGGRCNKKKEASNTIQRKRVVCSFPTREHFAFLCSFQPKNSTVSRGWKSTDNKVNVLSLFTYPN